MGSAVRIGGGRGAAPSGGRPDRTSAPSGPAVSVGSPAPVSRTASPSARAPAPSSAAAPDRHEEVDVRRVGHAHDLARRRSRPPHSTASRWRIEMARVVALARRDRHQAATVELAVDVELLVAGVDRSVSGRTHICTKCTSASAAGVHLRVPDPRAGAHPLGQARVQQAPVALGVLVLELAVEHPRDDLHVLVRVGAEARARDDAVVVAAPAAARGRRWSGRSGGRS